MLDVRRLHVLRAVIETGSLTAAADLLSYTPSAVHQHIAALERETGLLLFDRVGRRLQSTAAALALNEQASCIFSAIGDAERLVDGLRSGRTGRIRIAAFPTAGSALVPPAIASFESQFPEVQLDVSVLEPDEAMLSLREGTVDLAVIVQRHGAQEIEWLSYQHLISDSFNLVLPKQHHLSKRRKISLSDLATDRWISTQRPSPLCQDIASEACRASGFEPNYSLEGDEYTTTISYVAAGLGVSLVPRLALCSVANPGVVVRPITTPVAREVYAISRSSQATNPLTAAMTRYLVTAASTLSRSS